MTKGIHSHILKDSLKRQTALLYQLFSNFGLIDLTFHSDFSYVIGERRSP
jgi:hypothetical protein